VLITGGASGIGRLLALRFAGKGSKVVLWDINQSALTQTLHEIVDLGGDAEGYVVDVTDRKVCVLM